MEVERHGQMIIEMLAPFGDVLHIFSHLCGVKVAPQLVVSLLPFAWSALVLDAVLVLDRQLLSPDTDVIEYEAKCLKLS